MKNKSLAYILGCIFAYLVLFCIMACLGSIVLTATFKFITWIFAFL